MVTVSGMRRAGAAAWRAAARLVPAGRRAWVEAVWAEAPQVPPGLRRLAWRAGGVRLIAREALMRRGIGSAALFTAAAALAAWAAWPGAPASFATSVDRVDVITIVAALAGLALVARWIFGPPGRGRAARLLRPVSTRRSWPWYRPRTSSSRSSPCRHVGGTDLRLYRLISGPGFGNKWQSEITFLVVIALYAAPSCG